MLNIAPDSGKLSQAFPSEIGFGTTASYSAPKTGRIFWEVERLDRVGEDGNAF